MPSHVIPATHFDLLEKPLLAHVATIGPHGEPQTNPIWYIWDNDRFWMSIGPTGQKAKNLERDPRIAVSMADPENPIHYLELRGSPLTGRRSAPPTPWYWRWYVNTPVRTRTTACPTITH